MIIRISEIEKVSKYLVDAKYAIALTGAGISTESGIPDFRGPKGLWKRINPEYATYTFFREHPDIYWKFHMELYNEIKDVNPNPAHYSLAELEKLNILKAIITQNIDGLHQKAGSKTVIELHGNLRTITCMSCGAKYNYDEIFKIIDKYGYPPRCRLCNGILKPDVVLFGESLPYDTVSAAYDEALKADLIMVLGTSLAVYPAAYIPDITRSHGGKIVIINLMPTEKDHVGDIIIYGKLGDIIPKIVEHVKDIL